MAEIWTRATRQRQPTGAVAVNWGNPYTRSAKLIWSAAAPLLDATTGRALTSSGIVSSGGAYGQETRLTQVGPTKGYIEFTDRLAVPNNFTIFCVIKTGADITSGQFYFSRVLESGAFPFNWVIDIVSGNLRFFSNADSYAQLTYGASSNTTYIVAGTVDSAKVWRLYINGRQVATRNATGDPTTTGAQSVRIGANNGNIYPLAADASVLMAYGADQALSASEIALLSANPWQLFAPERRVSYFFPASGGVTVNATGVSATGDVGTVTATGASTYTASGVSATGSVGTVTATGASTYTASGVSATGSVGTVTATGASTYTATGVSATGDVGTVTVSTANAVTVNVTGVNATGDVGTVTVTGASTYTATGVTGTGAVGTVTVVTDPSITVFVSGVFATGFVGTVNVWSTINDNQTPNWQASSTNQTPAWGPVSNVQSANWQ